VFRLHKAKGGSRALVSLHLGGCAVTALHQALSTRICCSGFTGMHELLQAAGASGVGGWSGSARVAR
jgi:hypothetical protein